MTEERSRILIVDDQPDNLLVLADLLGGLYEVQVAGSGREALEIMAGSDLPDLLLLDVLMPEPDGFEVCRTLREWPGSRDVPIVFLTSLDGADHEEQGLAAGADDFIRKPFIPMLVLARVRNLLCRRDSIRRQSQMAVVEARLAEQQKVAETLRSMVDKLMAMNIELERFAFVAAHDLREPLRSVVCFSQLLERQCGGRLDTDERKSLRHIIDGARRMYDLLGGLLAFSRVPANVGRRQKTNTARVCALAIENQAAFIADSGATITVAGDMPEVEAVEPQLVQVFQNLIGNGIKFHHLDRPPHVEVAARRMDGAWLFSVADNGIGFDSGKQDVFELFRQLHRHEGFGGSGVGLAICKRIVQGLGGRIWFETALGQGSTFFFTVPDRPAPPSLP
jgi:signal transduction histidine kinase